MRAIWIILAVGGLGCSSPDAVPCETQSSPPVVVTVLDPSGTVACDAMVTGTQGSRTVDLALTSGSPCDYEGLYGETGTWTITAKRAGHADATATVALAASPTGACADQPPPKHVSVTPQ